MSTTDEPAIEATGLASDAEPPALEPDERDKLSDTIGEAGARLITIANKMDRERKQRTRRIWFQYFLTFLVLGVAVYAVLQTRQANHDRAARTRAACAQDADRAKQGITGFDEFAVGEADKLAPQPRSAKTQAIVDDYLASQHRKIGGIFKVRNCTPDGIRDYYSIPEGPNAFLPPPPRQDGLAQKP